MKTLGEIYKFYEQQPEVICKKTHPETLRKIRKTLDQIGWNKSLVFCTPKLLQEYVQNRLKTAKPSTVNREVSACREMVNKAIFKGYLNKVDNPFTTCGWLKENNVRQVVVRKEDVDRLIKCADTIIQPIILIQSCMPMRRSEIIELHWEEIDLTGSGLIRLSGERTKNSCGRAIPLPSHVRNLLCSLPTRHTGGYVFENYREIKSRFDYEFRKARTAANLDITFHDLRHVAIHDMHQAKISQYLIMRFAGHKTESMFRRYMYLTDDDIKGVTW